MSYIVASSPLIPFQWFPVSVEYMERHENPRPVFDYPVTIAILKALQHCVTKSSRVMYFPSQDRFEFQLFETVTGHPFDMGYERYAATPTRIPQNAYAIEHRDFEWEFEPCHYPSDRYTLKPVMLKGVQSDLPILTTMAYVGGMGILFTYSQADTALHVLTRMGLVQAEPDEDRRFHVQLAHITLRGVNNHYLVYEPSIRDDLGQVYVLDLSKAGWEWVEAPPLYVE